MVPEIEDYRENEFIKLLDTDESRQALHITYGYLLCDKSETGRYIFREEFFKTLEVAPIRGLGSYPSAFGGRVKLIEIKEIT